MATLSNTKGKAVVQEMQSEQFAINTAVRQGEILSTVVFTSACTLPLEITQDPKIHSSDNGGQSPTLMTLRF